MEKYKSLVNGKTAKIVRRNGEDVTFVMDGFVSHAHIDWFMENFKKI